MLTLAQSIAHFRARLFEKSSARPARRLALRCGLPLGVLAMQSLQGIVIGGVVLSPDAAWAQGDGAANAAAVAGTPLPLSRITLYRSGVASMERKGTVNGDANVQLTFRADQINDILKSMIVLDQGGGTVRSVEYASQEGLQRRLASCSTWATTTSTSRRARRSPSHPSVSPSTSWGSRPRASA